MNKMILLITFLFAGLLFGQGSDNASNSAYNSGWNTGTNGGTGFGAWTISNTGSGGVFIGSSNIDVSGESWGMWANSGGVASAVRDFSSPMGIYDVFTIFMDNGSVQVGGTVGFGLQNSSGDNILEVYFVGGQSNYTVDDNTAAGQNSNFGWTNTGIKVVVELNTATTYTVRITPAAGGTEQTVTGSISGTISRLRLFNANAGTGSGSDLFFNSIQHQVDFLPVELTLFTAKTKNNVVELYWQTATEINNFGFEVQRSKMISGSDENWEKIGFVQGNGTIYTPREYNFLDNAVYGGNYSYRLKQIDIDGKFEFSPVVEVSFDKLINGYTLSNNYPNPFNPSTNIKFAFQSDTKAELKIFDIAGNEVQTLFSGLADGGRVYSLYFDASGLSNGLYFYKLSAPGVSEVKKMLLLK